MEDFFFCVLCVFVIFCSHIRYISHVLLSAPLPAFVSSADSQRIQSGGKPHVALHSGADILSGHAQNWTVLTFYTITLCVSVCIKSWHHFRQRLCPCIHLMSGWDNPLSLWPSHAILTLKKHLLPPTHVHRHTPTYLANLSRHTHTLTHSHIHTALHTSC